MFLDYYEILEVDFNVSPENLKHAYRRQCKKWHPDKNPGIDTLKKMQLINEAYLFLKDTEARSRYDQEYIRFKSFQQTQNQERRNSNKNHSKQNDEFIFNDEILKKWMQSAREQADKIAKQSAEDFKRGAKAAGDEMLKSAIVFITIGIIFSLIFILGKSCN